MVSITQEGLVKEAAGGSRQAYAELVLSHQNLVSAVAFSLVSDVQISQDITQDVFLQAWRGLRKLRNPSSFRPWLRQLTRNHAAQYLRLKYRRPDASGLDKLAGVVDSQPNQGQ